MQGMGNRGGQHRQVESSLPSRVINVLVAEWMAAVVGVSAYLSGATTIQAVATGGLVFGVSIGLIYKYGYLIPGTPTMTERGYIPTAFQEWFSPDPRIRTDGGTADVEEPGIENPEATLVSVGALEEAPSGDLRVTSEFESAWDDAIADVKADEDANRDELVDVMGIDADGDVELEPYDDAFRITIDGALVGALESQAAFYADLAGARLLSDRIEEWEDLPVADRSRLLKGLRLFLETCPECGNDVVFDTKEVESCCGSHQVAAVDCDECGSRLFESAPIGEDL